MTAIQMNAELFRQLSIIAEDESMMAKLLKYAKKLTMNKEADPTLMTKEEFFRRVDEAKKGPLYKLMPGETLDDLIKRAV